MFSSSSILKASRFYANQSVLIALGVSSSLALVDTAAAADEKPKKEAEVATTSIIGKVKLPDILPESLNKEGLKLSDTVLLLEGKYNHPSRPFPENWKEMKADEKRAWSTQFKESEEYAEYRRQVEKAKAGRATYRAEIQEDGSFSFDGIKANWYQLTAAIMHPSVEGGVAYGQARGYMLRQFFVKDVSRPLNLGTLELEVKNVLWTGETAPDIVGKTYEGEEFKLSDFRGRYVLFDFWATWCIPCIEEIPNLEALAEEFGGEQFEVIGFNVDEKFEDAEAFLERRKIGYSQAYLSSEMYDGKARDDFGITSIPSIWLIDPEGVIIARDLLEEGVTKSVREALKGKIEKK